MSKYNDDKDPLGQQNKILKMKEERKTYYKDKNYFEVSDSKKKVIKKTNK